MPMIVRNEDDWLTATINGRVVIMHTRQNKNISLDEMGARIWDIIETPRTIDDICAILLREFDVPPDVCRAEVERFVGEFKAEGALANDRARADA